MFRTFDFASPDTSTPQRYTTTVPQQALFLMNSPFVVEQARHFVQRPTWRRKTKDEAKIDRMYRLAYGRAAEADEIALRLHSSPTHARATTRSQPDFICRRGSSMLRYCCWRTSSRLRIEINVVEGGT